MIARIFFLLIPLIWLPAYYACRLVKNKTICNNSKVRYLFYVAPLAFTVYTCVLATEKAFAPKDISILYTYLFLLGVWIIPKSIWAICAFIGNILRKCTRLKHNYGHWVGGVLALFCMFVVVYGSFVTNKTLSVKREHLYFDNLPDAFDGYKIVHISDLHVGSYIGKNKWLLRRTIDSVNAQKPDAVMFTGDLQNVEPSEIIPHMSVLSGIKAKDGVFSVLGNHDYGDYTNANDQIKRANEQEMIRLQRALGWTLLKNEHVILHKQTDSIVVAGVENNAIKPLIIRTDVKKAMKGVDKNAFTILLQHDPSVWKNDVINQTNIPLTLCGHTHGGQVNIAGLRITMFKYDEDLGLYQHRKQMLYVSTGVGGLIPFRFGEPPSITVITLHKKK